MQSTATTRKQHKITKDGDGADFMDIVSCEQRLVFHITCNRIVLTEGGCRRRQFHHYGIACLS
jgi:hypothetical protein